MLIGERVELDEPAGVLDGRAAVTALLGRERQLLDDVGEAQLKLLPGLITHSWSSGGSD